VHFIDKAYLSDDLKIVMKKISIRMYNVSCINTVILIFIYVLNVYLFDTIKLKASSFSKKCINLLLNLFLNIKNSDITQYGIIINAKIIVT